MGPVYCGRQNMPLPCKWWLGQPPRAAWWPWPLIFWPWKLCGMSPVARTTFLPILMFLRLFVVELWADLHRTDDVTLLPRPLTFRPLNGVTDHSCLGLPSCHFQLFTPFHYRLGIMHGTDRLTDRRPSSMHNAPTLWWRGIIIIIVNKKSAINYFSFSVKNKNKPRQLNSFTSLKANSNYRSTIYFTAS